MRKTILAVSPLLALGFLAASCSRQAEHKPASVGSEAAAAPSLATAAPSPADTAAPGAPRDVRESNELIDFEYAYPDAAGAIPSLKAMLDGEVDKRKAELVASAKEQQAESKKNDFPYHPLGSWTLWKVVADLPDWLSLSADVSDYQGGAHPNHGFDALLWDKRANVRRAPIDLFVSKEALSRAIRKDFCAALNRQRAKKRGAPIDPKSTNEFDQCIDPAASTIILGSASHRAFDRIGVLVAPYEAGPYAEGDYDVTLPVTDAVLAAVKPEYRSSFATKR
jgi:hypothetical protein